MNATVTLPIGDLDKLRNDLKEAIEKVQLLENTQKQVKLIVSQKQFKQIYEAGFGYSPGYYRSVEYLIDQKPQYINFDEVKEELKKEAESAVIEKIGGLERELAAQKQKYQSLITSHAETIAINDKNNQEIVKNIKLNYEATIENLNKEIKTLKGELVDLGKDEQIVQLKKEIEQLKSKNFIQRLFNL